MFSVEPEAVLASSGVEAAITAETAAAASSASPALLGVLPMGNDPDSIAFQAALLASGSEYLGIVAEHSANGAVLRRAVDRGRRLQRHRGVAGRHRRAQRLADGRSGMGRTPAGGQ